MRDRCDKTTRREVLKELAGATIASQLTPRMYAHGSGADLPPEESGRGRLVLEDAEIRVAFDTATGALTSLQYKPTHWTIARRPEQGVSFHMQAPMPQRHDNFILGQKQRASRVEKRGNQIHLEWRNLLSERAGVLPITFSATVTLDQGGLTFESSLTNHSELAVNTVAYPYLGDLSAPTPQSRLWRRHMWYGNLEADEIYPHFRNEKGYWGDLSPLQTAGSRRSLFCLVQSEGQGFYVQVSDPKAAYFVDYAFEQSPGDLESVSNRVPAEGDVSGHPVHLEFRTTHFLFAARGSTTKLTPIVLRGYRGDWQAGVDIYKAWRRTWFNQHPVPDWVKDVHAWYEVQMNSPEDSLRYPYRDLPKLAEDCARHGVRAIQLVGWSVGGQDRGNPSEDTDPRLGARKELENAIAQAEAKGVKIVLFGKFNWADMTTAWYRGALDRYETKDPYEIRYEHGGYSYDTAVQLAAINNRRFAVMCFRDAAFRQVAASEFRKVTALHPAGFLYDEVCHHGVVLYCFAKDHGHPDPAYIYAGDIPMAEALDEITHHDPNFLFAGEGPEDILLQHYPCSYFRIGNEHTPVCRYIDSQAPLIVAVTGFDDREKLNRCLLYRYIISYEPYNFKGRLSDFPLTLEYGKKIDALRKRYRRWLWDAEYRDRMGANVMVNGAPHRLYSVFRTPEGDRAVVVVNQDFEKGITASVDLPKPGRLAVVTPEAPEEKSTKGRVEIPARSAAVIIEQ